MPVSHLRLLSASKFAYTVTGATAALSLDGKCLGDVYAYGLDVGYVAPPVAYVGGADLIDAATVGRIAEGVLIAFRGTLPPTSPDKKQTILDWVSDLDETGTDPNQLAQVHGIAGAVHRGFFDGLQVYWNALMPAVDALFAEAGCPQALYIAGHSKGGAVANIAARAFQCLYGGNKEIKVVTFEAARPGDANFAADYNAKIGNSVRYENDDDIVPHLPPEDELATLLADLGASELLAGGGFMPVGTLQFIQQDGSLVPQSPGLDEHRLEHIAGCLVLLRFEKIVDAHSIDTTSRVYQAVSRSGGQS